MAKVVCVHKPELKPGVSAEEFEKYVVEEMLPLYVNSPMDAYVLKGDKGERRGKFGLILVMDEETRDKYFGKPPSSGADFSVWTDEMKRVQQKYYSMVESSNFTDYVVEFSNE